ncbi:MAG: hypothetical protein GY822_01605 [Deltaproteobacteria bacterium]|nr:hypothetical protein [Deltaproteobacteria bacterium]
MQGSCVFTRRPTSVCPYEVDFSPAPNEPEPVPEPQPEPVPEPQPEPVPEPQPEPVPEPQPEPDPEPSCADELEPNNRRRMASPLTLPASYSLEICTNDDEDFFSFNLENGQSVVAEIFFDHQRGRGDLDMRLFGSDSGSPLDSSEDTNDFERIEYQATTSGTFFLSVFGYIGSMGEYDLNVETRATICENDFYEPNDVQNAGFPLVVGVTGAQMCPGDDDWFRLLSAGPYGRIDVDAHDIELLVEVFNGDVSILNQSLIPGETTGIDFPTMQIDALLHVSAVRPSESGSYTIRYAAGVDTCISDDWEPNDAVNTATERMTPFSHVGTLCDGDVDILRPDYSDFGTIQISLSTTQDVTAVVVDENTFEVLATISPNSAQEVSALGQVLVVLASMNDAEYVLDVF